MADEIIKLQDVLDMLYENPDHRKKLDELLFSMPNFLGQVNERFSGADAGNQDLQIKSDITSKVNNSYYEDIIKSDLTGLNTNLADWNSSVKNILDKLILVTQKAESEYQIIDNENPESDGSPKIIFLKDGEPFEGAIKLSLDEKDKIYYDGKEYALYYRINDLDKANAGASFSSKNPIWVIPFHNRIGSPYTEERTDEILSALENSESLKFTYNTTKITPYVNLLTDLYKREVEVEDLNRDFWVISQVISAIINYLFNEDGVFGLLKDILKEIAQLWQNIVYLYNLIQEDEKREAPYTHVEIVYINCNFRQGQFRYESEQDKDQNEVNLSVIIDRLIKEYVGCNLIIIPILVKDYYEENFHQTEEIPYIYCYDRKAQKGKRFFFQWGENVALKFKKDIIREEQDNRISFSLKGRHDFDSYMHCYRDDEVNWKQYVSNEEGDYELLKIKYEVKEDCFYIYVQSIEPIGEEQRLTHLTYCMDIRDLQANLSSDDINVIKVMADTETDGTKIDDIQEVVYYQGEMLSRRREDESVSIES